MGWGSIGGSRGSIIMRTWIRRSNCIVGVGVFLVGRYRCRWRRSLVSERRLHQIRAVLHVAGIRLTGLGGRCCRHILAARLFVVVPWSIGDVDAWMDADVDVWTDAGQQVTQNYRRARCTSALVDWSGGNGVLFFWGVLGFGYSFWEGGCLVGFLDDSKAFG